MPVSETRLAVRLQDNATSGLQSLTNAYNRFSSTVQNSGRNLAQFNRQVSGANMGGFASNADKAASSLKNMNQMMERLVYSASRYFVIYKALGAVGNVWDTLVGGSYDYAKSLETNQIGIAGILKSMITLNGEQLAWNDAMAMSGKAMKGLQSEALRTAATSKELIETFRALLGPGLSSGMSIDQIVQLSTVGTNAVRSLGLPTNQYVQELRSIITEGIRPASSTLATSLGITNKDIKEAKASAEGLFNFLMKRMQGFSDAVKYTSGTVEGRIARIQEGLQVAGAKGADSLYKAWSNTLERIANYLIPVPEKLGEKWEINPEFVKSIERIAQTTRKIAESLANVVEKIGPALGSLGGGALTAIGQFADKLGYVLALAAGRKLAPFVTDIVNIALHSREAYEAQTALGRAIQAVSDKISGRVVDLQRAIEQQNVYNASIDVFFAEMNRMNTMNGMINSNANSITNLAAKWQRMGVDASTAGEIQNKVLTLMKNGFTASAQEQIRYGDIIAKRTEKTKQYEDAVKQAYNTELKAIRAVIAEQNNRKLSAKEQVTAFLNKEGDKKPYKWQIESTNELIGKLQQLKLEEEQVYGLTLQYTNALKKGGQDAAAAIEKQIVASAQNFLKTKQNLAVKQEEIVLNNRMVLEQSALANAYRQGGEGAYQALTKIIERERNLLAEMQKRGIATEEVERRHIELLNIVATATNEETTALLKNTEQVLANKEAQVGLNAAKQKTIERANAMISTFSNLSMGFGILCDVIGQADEENKEWYESAGNAAMQASMFAMAIGSISSAIAGMIPALARGIKWLNKFAAARSLAGLGVVGAVGVGVAAVIKNAYNNYKRTGIASAVDDWTGEEISHDFGNQFGNPQEMHDIDDADSYAILNTPDVGNVGLINPPSVGGSSGGGKGGGASKANKAEEYAAKMQKIYADLDKEIVNMSAHTSAYDKTMAQAKDKIAGYEKDIVKAQQLGVDVGEVRNKQIEYKLAMEKKAWEAQQDEYLKYMKQDEEAANRINIMGGTMEEQRAVLAERLENHKAYLEELLAANIENRDRRMQLEQELANVQKQINDNSVYEFKSGWTQALDEIANRQVNFKDQVVGAFDSIEGSLVTLVSSTGSAKDRFKQFLQDVTNSILKSMTQIIIKGLITKAIMAAIGWGGGTDIHSWDNSKLVSMPAVIKPPGRASGGSVSAGGTYLVGENGPELLHMGSQSGRVYNNRQTDAMMNGGYKNIKIELKNESGTDLKTSKAEVSYDSFGDMVITAWIDKVTNNAMGSRDLLKGMANA